MALEELFQTDRVDLVILPEADPYLALDIIRGELFAINRPAMNCSLFDEQPTC